MSAAAVDTLMYRGLGALPGASTTTYRDWNRAVEAAGGAAVTWPGHGVTPAARYPAVVFVPRVNAREWPQPSSYSTNGQYAYYPAPTPVVIEVSSGGLTRPTPAEIDQGAEILKAKWLAGAKQLLGTAAAIGALGAVIYLFGPAIRRGLSR